MACRAAFKFKVDGNDDIGLVPRFLTFLTVYHSFHSFLPLSVVDLVLFVICVLLYHICLLHHGSLL